jgi:ferredoxin-NADP reductase
LVVKEVIEETDDAVSIVFDVPLGLEPEFGYRAGQFVTLRIVVDGSEELRSYSMSSAPGIDRDLQITVKRVAEGVVSNWILEHVRGGESLDVSAPAGAFVLPEGELTSDVAAFAAGSGITPIFSIVKSVLEATDRHVRMVYANRNRSSVIFQDRLQSLEAQHPERLQITYNLDDLDGLVQPRVIADALGSGLQSEFYVCGPKGFMDMVRTTLVWCGVRSNQLHVELFSPDGEVAAPGPGSEAEVTVTLRGKTVTIVHRPEWTLVQAARVAGLRPPTSCHLGQCGTCVAQVTEGRAQMANNQVLTAEEVADGWILTCQAKPVTPQISVVYE